MKKTFLITLLLIMVKSIGQNKNVELCSKYDFPKEERNFILENFQGIEKLDFSFKNLDLVFDKKYKLIIKKFKKGKIEFEKTIIDSDLEGLPKIDEDFKFSIVTQQLIGNQKVTFFFTTYQYFNNQNFTILKKFKPGTFSLRNLTAKTDKIEIEVDKENQIALITPPNEDPKKGNLGYCEISKSQIDIEDWYKKYQIPDFFLVYLVIEK